MHSWTKAQEKAIEIENKTLLVSAAAGSGKTTVLIERIIRSLTKSKDPLDISKMLVVTFTRAAAAELKQKISNALTKAIAQNPSDKRLFKQLAALGSAHISTIDSFYGDIVRRHSNSLAIPSNLRIADDSELIRIRRRVMNEAIDLGYSGALSISEEQFASLTDQLSDMRDETRLFEVFYKLYNKLSNHPRNIDYLLDCAKMYDDATPENFFECEHGKVIADYIHTELQYIIRILNDALDYFNGYPQSTRNAFLGDLDFCQKALEILNSKKFEALQRFWLTYSPKSLVSPPKDLKTEQSEYFFTLRTKFVKEKILHLSKNYFGAGFSPEELKKYAKKSADNCRALHALLSCFDKAYKAEKLSLGICEFGDIKLWAYELLVKPDGSPTELALSVAEGFDAIYIDEYQDVDLVQDLIFKAISKPRTRFMVGDVKQSIYRFRGTEPTLFVDYRRAFASVDCNSETLPKNDDCTVFMSENFRCDRTVIDFANEVCSYLFKTGSLNIDYNNDDDLRFSKKVPDGYTHPKVNVTVIDRKKATVKHENAEAAYIASEINRLINEETKADGTKITPEDIAVFSRDFDFCLEVAAALNAYGIKHSAEGSANALDDPEVLLAISLLNTIDNPMRDVHLAATLISPLFNFTADEIIKIQHENNENACSLSLYDAITQYSLEKDKLALKCKSFIEELSELREATRSLPADKTVKYIYSRYSFLTRAYEKTSSHDALISLYENARRYEGDTFKGLYSYLKYVEELINNDLSLNKDREGFSEGVRLMTMHKSKGLEFPVCFVTKCSKSFNTSDSKAPLLYSSQLGIATNIADETGFGNITTPYRKAVSRAILNSTTEEEMCLLYVALTRARERLYVTANPTFGADREFEIAKASKLYGGRAAILDSANYLSWILTALYGSTNEGEVYNLTKLKYEDIPDPSTVCGADDEAADENDQLEESTKAAIINNLNYEYAYLHVANLPAKLSVSKLTPSVLDRTEEKTEDDPDGIDVVLPKVIDIPSFMGDEIKPSAAERGTATHTFLQFCDFENAKAHGVKEEIDRLVSLGFINRAMADLVSIKQISAFLRSSLYEDIQNAKRVYREQRFNILLSAKEFTNDADYAALIENEKLLVQGVIDLFFEDKDGRIVLCDYKTDYLTPEELNDKELARKKLSAAHSRQLSYYAAALGEILGRAPDRVIVYSLPLGDSVEIEL